MVEFTIHALSNHPVISTTHFLDVLNLCSFEGWRPSPGLAVISFGGYGCNINPVDLRLAKTERDISGDFGNKAYVSSEGSDKPVQVQSHQSLSFL